MKKTRPDSDFDCLEFKRRAQAEIIEETRGMTSEQEIEYFRREAATGPFAELWKSLPVDPFAKRANDSAA